jgi:hypothetical protein
MPQRFLIACATSDYLLHKDLNRPAVAKALESIVQLFTQPAMGYERVLEEIGSNPTSTTVSAK